MVTLRFCDLWKRIRAEGEPLSVFEDILVAYFQPHRHYHGFGHLIQGLEELEWSRVLCHNPNAVEFAIHYHDFIFDPKAKDNKEKSAEAARKVCSAAGLSDDFTSNVCNLILATKHDRKPETLNERVINDINFKILGSNPEEYRKYRDGIRKEYASIKNFNALRTAFLKSRLKKPFSLDIFMDKYGVQAEKNIKDELKRLK